MELGQALKAFRRNTYVHGEHWNAIVVYATEEQGRNLFDEACRIMDGGSLGVTMEYLKRVIVTDYGNYIRFARVDDAEKSMLGRAIPHVILACTPTNEQYECIRKLSRPVADTDERREDKVI